KRHGNWIILRSAANPGAALPYKEYDQFVAGPAVLPARNPPKSPFRFGCNPFAAPRHWRRYGNFHAGGSIDAATAANQEPGSTGDALSARSPQREQYGHPHAFLSDLPGHSAE